jgi:hypothetical protein
VIVPREEISPQRRVKATDRDINELERLLVRHFAGLTTLAATPGFGLRDPQQPEAEPEMNINQSFVVYTAPVAAAQEYFRALQAELRAALVEGVILIERQEVLLL